MRQLLLQIRYTPQSTQPRGAPPSFEVDSGPGTVSPLDGTDPKLKIPTHTSYSTQVTENDSGTFDEVGTYVMGEHELQITTVGSGMAEPYGEDGTLRGAVIWRLEDAATGTSGYVTSNIRIDQETGSGDDYQIVRLFIP